MTKAFLFVHLLTLVLGILSFLIGSFWALLYFIEQRQLKRKKINQKVFLALDHVDRYASVLVKTGFWLLTVAMVTGIYLAHFYWNSQWFFNIKFILSMVVWLWYLGVMLLKTFRGLKGQRFLLAMVLGLFLTSAVFFATYFWSFD